MRKVILTVAAALCLGTATVKAEKISRADAREIASMVAEISDQTSDDTDWAPYYVFSRGAGNGFVIISGDDQTAPVIGIIDQGDFVLNEMPVQLQEMLASWSERITTLQSQTSRKQVKRRAAQRVRESILGVDEFKANWTSVAPLIQTHWHQSSPYNDLAPRRTDNNNKALTGCVATAGSQVLYYFRKDLPDSLLYATPTYSYGGAPVTESLPKGTPIEYDIMKLSGSGTTKQNKAVATLMYAVGTSSYLTYAMDGGTATGGYIGDEGMNKAFANQFQLSCQDKWKWAFTQKGWEQLAYQNLSEGRPMVYAGSNSDGGHAVVLDGYQASTGLYHFNFGWGGSGDGYFTIDDETGMNGFNTYQEMLSGAAPKKQNLEGRITNESLWQRCNNDITCVVKNNGTLSYSGFRLWASTTGKRPTTTSATETTTVIASGDSAVITFTYKPSLEKTYYLFLTDNNNNPLDTIEIVPQPTVADLTLNSMSIDAGSTNETLDGITYRRVNNTSANIAANFTNSTNGTYCEPQVKCIVQKYNTESGEWEAAKTKTITIERMQSGESRDTTFTFNSLSAGVRYKAYFDRTVKAGENSELNVAVSDTVIYFTVAEPTLAITTNGRAATVTGDWNAARFTKLASDESVTSYDLTGVSDLNSQPEAANPNAVFTATSNTIGAKNVVAGGVCSELLVYTGYNFKPAAAFTATKATLVLSDLKAGHWVDAIVPFAAPVPEGMVVRTVSEVKSASMTLESQTSVPAMTPLLVLTDYDKRNEITASDVAITTDTAGYHLDGMLSGQTTQTELTATAMLIGYNENDYPYYYPADSATQVKPFATVLNKYYKNGYRAMNTVGLDRAYILMADSLNRALSIYDEYKDVASAEALATFADSIAATEKLFTSQSALATSDVTKQTRYLSDAIQAFLDALNGGETGIVQPVMLRQNAEGYYDLSGRKIARPTKRGIYISNGQKLILK